MYQRSNSGHLIHILQVPCRFVVAVTLLLVLLSSFPLQAQFMVQSVNLDYLVRRADVIVQGHVVAVAHEQLPGYPNIPTVTVTLNVEKMLRGPSSGTYTFREMFLGLRSKEGKQSYKIGQRLLLFLPAASQFGLSSPIGIEQGRFHVAAGSGAGAIVSNEFGNYGLFKDVENSANKAGIQLTKKQSQIAASRNGPVLLNDFVSLVQSLTSLPRIR
jgi:hypothetical protein